MKSLVWTILIILIVSLISGCISKTIEPEPIIKIEYVNKYIECPAPLKPNYLLLDTEYHIGHKINLEIIRTNFEFIYQYVDRLENTLNCYKNQTME